MKSFSEKGIVHIVPLLVVLAIAGVVLWFFLNKGESGTRGTTVPIPPSQLMPFVSAAEARATICNLKKEELFAQVCQSKFDVVGKEDVEKITELFALLEKIQNDKSIPDYERLLLAQAVFAALPIGDNPETSLYQPTLLTRLKDYLTSRNIAYAQEKAMSEEEFKKMMERDLKNVVDSLPKGDNAWVINIMVSKYSWIDGKSRPLYSHQYLESFNPFPNNPNVNTRDINYNIRSIVGSKAASQTVDVGGPYKGTSEMFAYSFTIVSWNSKEYTSKDGAVEEQFLVDRWDFSDANYWGEHHLTGLLDAVKMPPTKRPTESPDEKKSKLDSLTNAQGRLTCEGMGKIIGSKECPQWVMQDYEKGLWCAQSMDELVIYTADGNGVALFKNRPPDYTLLTTDMSCLSEDAKKGQ